MFWNPFFKGFTGPFYDATKKTGEQFFVRVLVLDCHRDLFVKIHWMIGLALAACIAPLVPPDFADVICGW